MKAGEFTEYLEEEGLTDIIEARKQRGEASANAKERYTMYAKALLLSGAPDDGYSRPVGTPIEIVPMVDPYRLKAGEPLRVRVLFRGQPVANVAVKALSTRDEDGKQNIIGRTNADGVVSIPSGPGLWRVQTIHMERSTKPDVDWESYWATLTFEVP
jgi:uncharacterized GH25 family protein